MSEQSDQSTISRRSFLQSSVLFAAGTAFSLSSIPGETQPNVLHAAQSGMQHDRPNILWVSTEDIGPRIGAYGDPVARTPNIDRLAREGLRFDQTHTTAGVCSPVRCGIITAMYQTSIGGHHMRTTHEAPGLPTPYSAVPPHYVKTFTEYLRANGYYCTNNSKEDYQFETPVTAWDESSREAHWRNRADENQPFFAVFNFTTTHESQIWGEPETTDPADVEVPPYYPDTLEVRKHIAKLYDQIAIMDGQVGEILTQLEEDGLTDNTIVFFWGDHGDGLPRAKRWLYESGTRIPLIIKAPGLIEPGSVSDELVSSIDFGPTVLSLAGIPVPQHMQGQPFLGQQKADPREYIFGARDRIDESYDMVRMVRDNRYRYIRNYYPEKPYVLLVPYRNRNRTMQELLRMHAEGTLEGPQTLWMQNSRPPEELYDVQNDPHEINNLADDPEYQEIKERLSQVLDEWRIHTGDMGDLSEDQMVEQWYPNGEQPVTHAPVFSINAADFIEEAILEEGGTFQGPALLRISGPTHGSSVAYTLESGEDARWLLYSSPIPIQGQVTIRAKAIRYGYQESSVSEATFVIR